MTNDKLESARTGNWFLEENLVIARLDKLSRNEDVQEKLKTPDCRWDLIVCDEAHKMSATFFGNEVQYTKRYKLGQMLSSLTRHFLLMTATPHNGKEADFQLFMALLDGDRFAGKFRDGVHTIDARDMMRRMVKEGLLKFDGKPLFPERIAYTVPFKLSDAEARLYKDVTDYVREEFNRADRMKNDKRFSTIGFALTTLQRRLASSPEAILQSLRRRRLRLERRQRELDLLRRGDAVPLPMNEDAPLLDTDDIADLEEAPENELEEAEGQILDQATAAQSRDELDSEIIMLSRLEALALNVRKSGVDRKWNELAKLFTELFDLSASEGGAREDENPYGLNRLPKPVSSRTQKIVVFTEHRDTLSYLQERTATLLGRSDAIVMIHGGMNREDRARSQEAFKFDPNVRVLLATDAAGEGINLQSAHLMINYDLPWNPNRIEQRFGRIHRIGQTEVCHLWNLVAVETREGEVYRRLLDKIESARTALGGKVFDVLGKLEFEGHSLRDLLIEAIRYGDRPDVRARLNLAVDNAVDRRRIEELLEDKALIPSSMDTSRVMKIREEMERAEARRMQPHYIESFFREALARLGGKVTKREPRRFQVTHVPAAVRQRDRIIGCGGPVLSQYERITFEKDLIAPQGQALAAFICPGHPLLDAVIDLTLERNCDLLKRGTILVDRKDPGMIPRVLFYLEHAIRDESETGSAERRVISKRMLYVEMTPDGKTGELTARHIHYAPYLDYEPLGEGEPDVDAILSRPECAWITRELEQKAQSYAIQKIVPEHLEEVRSRRIPLLKKTREAVNERLSREIIYWDNRASQLKLQEDAGQVNARLNANEARKRADILQERLQKRLRELELEERIAPLPPLVLGGALIVPAGLLAAMTGEGLPQTFSTGDTQAAAARARAIVMDIERGLGFEPADREFEKLGYDIESRVPQTGKLRFIEVKGRISGAKTITVTKNEILYSLNKPEDFILAIVEFHEDGGHKAYYLRQPFQREPDFGVTSVNYDFEELLKRAGDPS